MIGSSGIERGPPRSWLSLELAGSSYLVVKALMGGREEPEKQSTVLGKKSLVCSVNHLLVLIPEAKSDNSVIVGSPHEPLTRSIATDLERRGFIVYITVSSTEEEHAVLTENRADIQALWLDLTTVSI
jgi:Fungal family of unknown function (DUF1776)